MKYIALAASLSISTSAILLDDITTFFGLAKGYVETNPLYPYSLVVTPIFYVVFLLGLDVMRRQVAPFQYNRFFLVLMLVVALLAFKGLINNILILCI